MQTPWGLCWKMESSNFWRNAISFMSPISLAAIEWCKTNLCATYIRQNLSNVSNVDKNPKHIHKHCKDYKGCPLSLSAVLTLALSHDFSFPMCHWLSTMSQKQSIVISLAQWFYFPRKKNSRIDMTSFIFGWTPIWHYLCWTPHNH